MTSIPVTIESPGDLCVGCGLCCNGTIFGAVPLTADEVLPAGELGLSLGENDDGEPWFLQPCSRLDVDRCSCYDDRPSTCREFTCALLESVAAGETTLADGHAIVARTREISDQVRSQLEASLEVTQRESIDVLTVLLSERMSEASDPHAFRRRHGEIFLGLATLRMSLVAHFYAELGKRASGRPLWSIPSIDTDR